METNNIELVRAAYAAFLRGDIPYVVSTLSTDVEWIEPGAPGIPCAGTYRGVEEVGAFFAKLADTTEILAFEPRDFLATRDTVGVFGYWRARARKTGRVFESDWAMYFRVQDGKICRFQSYVDTATEAAAHSLAAAA